jgi:hypothetical protein
MKLIGSPSNAASERCSALYYDLWKFVASSSSQQKSTLDCALVYAGVFSAGCAQSAVLGLRLILPHNRAGWLVFRMKIWPAAPLT